MSQAWRTGLKPGASPTAEARMAADDTSAPSWLFSFVDLAFLLLIAMTQVADPDAPDLGDMVLPRLDEKAAPHSPPPASGESWQVRVHPRADAEEYAFELRSSADPGAAVVRLDVEALGARLAEIQEAGADRPMLAPHADSRSQDLLDAASAIEERWPHRRRVTVARLAAGR